MNKKISLLATVLFFAASEASAQADTWLLQEGMTPQTLSSTGASLIDTDSMVWPDGRSVFVTYWLGGGDIVFRCAEIRDGETTSPSCWQRELVSGSATTSKPVVRSLSTRRRPLPFDPYQSGYALSPYIWVDANRWVPQRAGSD